MTLNILESRLIVASGMATGGKTTIARGIAQSIPNGMYLSRDDALYGGLLLVNDIATHSACLPLFATYVANDAVFPDFIEVVRTPFGPMHRVIHSSHSDFHFRHADNQTYILLARMAERLLAIGKVVAIDAWFSPDHFRRGEMKSFMEQPAFASYPRYFIYVTVDPEEAFRRWHARSVNDPESKLRGKSAYLDRETFFERSSREQLPRPEGLEEIPHLSLDTTALCENDALAATLAYIRS